MLTRDELRTLVRGLPKAELHVHLEGSMQPELALRLAARRGVALPGGEAGVEGLRRQYRFGGFRAFIDLYLALSACLQEADDISDATDDLARAHVAQGVVAAEVTFTPMTHRVRGVSVDVLCAGLQEGRARARDRGVQLRWVLDVVRHLGDQGEPTLAFAQELERRDPGSVAGLGLSGPETEGSTAPHAELFARARELGFAALPHAGEQAGAVNVREAIELLGARRIGHGVRCVEDPEVLTLVREREVTLEVCPSSNVALGIYPSLSEHPVRQLVDAGVRVVLASDDPPLFGTDLLEEHVRCAEAFRWDEEVLRALARRSLDARVQPA